MNRASQSRSAQFHADLVPNKRVRKKNEHFNSGAEQSCSDASQKIFKEWDALYTTQITQKSKKYHDGILRVASCGSHMNQVVLLNEDGAVLTSKFLKSVECIKTGHNFEFTNYLIEIGEPRIIPEDTQMEHSVQVAECSSSDEASFTVINSKTTHDEWSALYTTQITQKSKRYHDGILQLANCGLHMRQITLLNEDGAVLSSKYLSSVERVECGHTCEFPNYLVEICEKRNPNGDAITKTPLEQVVGSRSMSNIKLTNRRKDGADKTLPKDDTTKSPSEQVVGSRSMSNIKLPNSRNDHADKTLPKDLQGGHSVQVGSSSRSAGQFTGLNRPIRDASQILATLRRPSPQSLACDGVSAEDSLMSHSSDLVTLDVDIDNKEVELNVTVTTNSSQIMNCKPEDNSKTLDVGYQITTSTCSSFETRAACESSTCSNAIMAGNDHQCTSPLSKYSIPSKQLSWGQQNKTIEIEVEENSSHCSSDEEQHYANSTSPVKENVSADGKTSLSDQIMTLQQEWTTLGHRVSTVGKASSSISSLLDDGEADKILLSAPPPSCVAIEAGCSLSKDCSNDDDIPNFDLGFE